MVTGKLFDNLSFWKLVGTTFSTPVVIIKETGDIVYKNDIFKNLIRSKHSNISFYLDNDCRVQFDDTMFQFKTKKEMFFNTLKIKKNKGETLCFIYFIFPLKNSLFALFLIDNTKIHNENIMLNNIINTAPDPIFVKDEQHRYMYVNQAFSEALGYPALELLGKSDVDFFPKHETDIFYKIDRKTFKSEITTINEETFTGSVYGTRIISTKKSVFRTLTGNKILVGVIRDITELTEARESLKKYAQELKRQVNIRTKQLETKKNDLEHAVEKLKSLNSDLDCFAHMCCHELREPLRTISSFSKLAMDEYLSGENKNISHFLQTIHDRTLKMDRLIKSILKYSTNGLNTNAMSSFPLYDLITEVLTMLDSQIEEKKAVINFDTLPTIYADRLQILQLFQNLINNAIKFCAPSHSPIIHIYAKPKKEFIEFKIKDNGIGIDKKYHKEIFLPFKKFHSQSEGSMHGIGLSLCKKIIENHGGSIKMYSEKNAGTTFKFLLPTCEIN